MSSGLELWRRWCAPARTPTLKSVSVLGLCISGRIITYLAWFIYVSIYRGACDLNVGNIRPGLVT
jgi:hypothetical protein